MDEKTAFFNKYKYAAIIQHILYGVPASITLAQAAIESNYGKSALAKNANNFFGIKAYSNPDNLSVYYASDDLANEPFRMYDSARHSFRDHSIFLKENPRYKNLFFSDDYVSWAVGLKTAGYATASNYAASLISVIQNNDLAKYDYYSNNKYLMALLLALILFILIFTAFKIYKKWHLSQK